MRGYDKIPNPNVTVVEWLQPKPEYQGRVPALAAWDLFPSICNVNRAGVLVNGGYDLLADEFSNPRVQFLNRLKQDGPRVWDEETFDAIPFDTAMEYLKERKPRVLFFSFGETDDWAHEGDYAQSLNAAVVSTTSSGLVGNDAERALIPQQNHGRTRPNNGRTDRAIPRMIGTG